MKQLLRANLRYHGRRYFATGLAITISVAFVLVALTLGRAANEAWQGEPADRYGGAALVLVPDFESEALPQPAPSVLRTVEQVPGVAAVGLANSVYAELGVAPLAGTIAAARPEPFSGPELRAGRDPLSETEIVLDAGTAVALDLGIGDTVPTRIAFTSAPGPRYTIVGLTDSVEGSGGSTGAIGYVTAEGLELLDPDPFGAEFLVATASGAPPASVAESIRGSLGAESGLTVKTVSEVVQERNAVRSATSIQTTALFLLFPFIAVAVAFIVVTTTFQVVLSQREKEIGLLRTVGATAGQIRRLIVAETLAVGIGGAAAGTALGALLSAAALRFTLLKPDFFAGLTSLKWGELLGAFLLGIALALVAGARPAVRVAAVSPLDLLRQEERKARESGRPWFAAVGGIITITAGAAMIWFAFQGTQAGFIGAVFCGFLTLLGMVAALSWLLPALTTALGSPFKPPTARMATRNLGLNPRRTAATGTAIFIGVTLIFTLLLGAASLHATTHQMLDSRTGVDLEIVASGRDLTPADVDTVEAVAGVAKAALESGLGDGITLDGASITAFDASAALGIARANPIDPGVDGVLLAPGEGFAEGETVKLCGPGGCRDLSVVPNTSWSAEEGRAGVAPETLTQLGGEASPQRVLALLQEGADVEVVAAEIAAAGENLEVVGGTAQLRATFDEAVNVLLLTVLALLAVSVLVAMVGVANVLSLAVVERTREYGLLRALGMSRMQVSHVLTLEAILGASAALIAGAGAGFLFGWAGVTALSFEGVSLRFAVPWQHLTAVVLATLLAAILASWIPGRRASRIPPIDALSAQTL